MCTVAGIEYHQPEIGVPYDYRIEHHRIDKMGRPVFLLEHEDSFARLGIDATVADEMQDVESMKVRMVSQLLQRIGALNDIDLPHSEFYESRERAT